MTLPRDGDVHCRVMLDYAFDPVTGRRSATVPISRRDDELSAGLGEDEGSHSSPTD
jgi:hypothetical protein